ncbi:hypothetical protein Bca101_065154 [Brassica carinata]
MIKYASCTDPTESTVRRERVRFVEENGEIEKWKRLQARATAADFEGQSSRVFAADPESHSASKFAMILTALATPTTSVLAISARTATALLSKTLSFPYCLPSFASVTSATSASDTSATTSFSKTLALS